MFKQENNEVDIMDSPYSFYSSVELANKNLFDSAHDLYVAGLSDSSSYEDFRQYILKSIKDLDEMDRRTLLNDLNKSSIIGEARNETKKITFTFGVIGILILASIVILDFLAITTPTQGSGVNLITIFNSSTTTINGHTFLSNIFFGIFILFSLYCIIAIFTELRADAKEQLSQNEAIANKHSFYSAIASIIETTLM